MGQHYRLSGCSAREQRRVVEVDGSSGRYGHEQKNISLAHARKSLRCLDRGNDTEERTGIFTAEMRELKTISRINRSSGLGYAESEDTKQEKYRGCLSRTSKATPEIETQAKVNSTGRRLACPRHKRTYAL
ncbi:protein of unknown function [Aminobacter niigataensis]|nr:protein of unknown function [Aminobacter niigataensis]